ncbi:hypothetical protein G9A89_022913 [Geosiphon pyriformis]|nr:hypothetical protein G9A89_022913 [Geosiphon pyriformis]
MSECVLAKNGQTADRKGGTADSAIDRNGYRFVIVNRNVIDKKKFTSNIENMLSSHLTATNPNCIINKSTSGKKKRKPSLEFGTTILGNKVRVQPIPTYTLLSFDFAQKMIIKYAPEKRKEDLSLVQTIVHTVTACQSKISHDSVGTIPMNTTKKPNKLATHLNPDQTFLEMLPANRVICLPHVLQNQP